MDYRRAPHLGITSCAVSVTQGSESLSAQGCPLAEGCCECVSTCVCVWAPLAKRHRWLSLHQLGLVRQQAWTVHSRIRALRAHGGRVECPSRRMVYIDAARVDTGRGSVTNRKCARDVETGLHVQTQTHTARPARNRMTLLLWQSIAEAFLAA